MKDYFIRPFMMQQAKESSKGHHWIIELLIFLLISVISFIIIVFKTFFGMILSIIFNSDLITVIKNGNQTQINEMMKIFSTDIAPSILYLALFFEVFFLGAAIIYCCAIEKRKLSTLGFQKQKFLTEYLKGLIIGLLLIAIPLLISVLSRTTTIIASEHISIITLVLSFIVFMIQGMAEEVLFRGYFMISISRKSSIPTAIILNSLIFGLMHIFNPGVSVLSIIDIFLMGVLVSLITINQGNIWIAAGIHTMWNFSLLNLFGIGLNDFLHNGTIWVSKSIQNNIFYAALSIILILVIIMLSIKMTRLNRLEKDKSSVVESSN